MGTSEGAVRTIADELLDLVKKTGKISIDEASKKLKIPASSVNALVDFLVEERVFGIEYKFTTPYIYLYKEGVKKAPKKGVHVEDQIVTKEEFFKRSMAKKIPHEQVESLWRKYIDEHLPAIRAEFMKKAKTRNLNEEKIEELWKKYQESFF